MGRTHRKFDENVKSLGQTSNRSWRGEMHNNIAKVFDMGAFLSCDSPSMSATESERKVKVYRH